MSRGEDGMPETEVLFYREDDGSAPILDWLDTLPGKARVKCLVRLKRLEDLGRDLRRPEADLLRDEIYELRVGLQGVNYRMLYFFHGKDIAIVSHGLTKERRVPPREIDEAIERKKTFEADPTKHTFRPN